MENFIKDGLGILEFLWQAGLGELPTEALVWVMSLEGKDGLICVPQG